MEKYDDSNNNEFTSPEHALAPTKNDSSLILDYEKNLEFRRWLILLVFVLIQFSFILLKKKYILYFTLESPMEGLGLLLWG